MTITTASTATGFPLSAEVSTDYIGAVRVGGAPRDRDTWQPTPPPWQAQAACLDAGEAFIIDDASAKARAATTWCETCPVRAQCLEAGKTETWGIWGGQPAGRTDPAVAKRINTALALIKLRRRRTRRAAA